jgi:chromosome segregation protein
MLEAEIVTIGQEMATLENSIGAKNREIETTEAEKNQINADIEAMNHSISEIKRNYEDARSRLTDLKLSMASLNEKRDAAKNEINGTSRAIDENKLRKESAKNEISNAEKQIEAAYAELHAIQEQTKALVIDADEIRQQRILLREHLASESQQTVSQQQSLKTIRSQIDIVTKELADINAKTVEARIRIENIETGIRQKYGIDIKAESIITEEFEASQDIDRINALNEKIRDLGPVNLGTIEEYEELKTRYEFLTKQQQDLNMSIAELEEAISRINTTTRKKLRDAYDSLRIKFSDVFTTLFGGGKADIVLIDQENILESGIDIIAQPPGKKLQNINLLSGGEKALTAVALLFAGFLIKPSPLCILDEADAPLDESNTVRFAQMIKNLSNETQFIVITHNRTTMEVADYIYGITMEEPGASKAISLQFEDFPVSA